MDLNNKKATRQSYGEALVELGKVNNDVVVLDADLAGATKTNMFSKEFPERFFDMGIAEQDMIATAAGFATCGKIPYASTFAVFATGHVGHISGKRHSAKLKGCLDKRYFFLSLAKQIH